MSSSPASQLITKNSEKRRGWQFLLASVLCVLLTFSIIYLVIYNKNVLVDANATKFDWQKIVRVKDEVLYTGLSNVDKGLRGFVISKSETHLKHYVDSKKRTFGYLTNLDSLLEIQKNQSYIFSSPIDSSRYQIGVLKDSLLAYFRFCDEIVKLTLLDNIESTKAMIGQDKGVIPWQVWFILSNDLNSKEQKIISVTNTRLESANLLLNFSVSLLLVLLLIMIISLRKLKNAKTEVEFSKLEIQKRQDEILAQNEELRAQQEEITSINNRLEELVQERTAKLEARNQQLSEYAFFNAHKLRSPISTILGLQEVLRLTAEFDQKLLIIEKLFESVAQLDIVVKKGQTLLDNDAGLAN